MNRHPMLSAHPALAGVPGGLQGSATDHATSVGETLFRVGDRVRGVFFVLSGEVRLLRRSINGAEIIVQRSRGGFVAEASVGEARYHCDAIVAESGWIVRFPVVAFRKALDDQPRFRAAWTGHLAREVRKLRGQCERLSLKTAAERILHYVASEGGDDGLTLRESRKAWASELGITHEALYRTLRRLQEGKIVRIDGQRIVALQRAHDTRD